MPNKELIENCMLALKDYERIEKAVFFPIPVPSNFNATIRIYASTIARQTLERAIPIIAEEIKKELEGRSFGGFNSAREALEFKEWWQSFWGEYLK